MNRRQIKQKLNKGKRTKAKKFLVEFLIALIKFLGLAKKVLVFFFVLISVPLFGLGKFFFNKIIIKFYCHYLSLVKKVGGNKSRRGFWSFVLSQRTVHVLVISLSFFFVLNNFFVYQNVQAASEEKTRAMIADLVRSEFGSHEEDKLIEKSSGSSGVPPSKSYLNNLDTATNKSGVVMDSNDEEEGGEMANPPESRTAENESTQSKQRDEVIEYTVQSGDTISTIAAKFGISANTILWENDLSSHSLIRPGDELTILPVSGVTHKISQGETLSYISSRYDIEASKIKEVNKLASVNSVSTGKKLIIPGGEKKQSSVQKTKKSTNYNAVNVVKKIVKPKEQATTQSNKMHWPTQGHRITQYYSWKHHGLDIANKTGTPLYAADAGTVEYAGWTNGYGYNVVINHGGGKKTRYAHMSKLYVKRGTVASKGQTLGEMGSTGWSTGPHIHFEVIINGKKYNPLNYIK